MFTLQNILFSLAVATAVSAQDYGNAAPSGYGGRSCLSKCTEFVSLTDVPISGRGVLHSDGVSTDGILTIQFGKGFASADLTVFAHVHEFACSEGEAPGGGHWQRVVGGPVDPTNEMWFELMPNGFSSMRRTSKEMNTDVVVPHPSAPDGGRSIVVHDADGTRLGCCTLLEC